MTTVKPTIKPVLKQIEKKKFAYENGYKPRKDTPVTLNTSEAMEIFTVDWFECDLNTDNIIERKDHYLNQEHNKSYTIFVFGATRDGNSVCLRIKNYKPYFYIQIPSDFTSEQIEDFKNCFDPSRCDDHDPDEIEHYEELMSNKDYTASDLFRFNSRFYKDSIEFKKTEQVERKIFWSFMNEQKFQFIKLSHKSSSGMKFMEKLLKKPIKLPIRGKSTTAIKYNLFESDLEPVLRFLHDSKAKPSSWLHIDGNKYKLETRQSKCQINVSCDWSDISPLDRAEVPPLVIASFDIEADSSHGDFPIAKKDCKKLSNQLAITWIREHRIIEKRAFAKYKHEQLTIPANLIATEKGQSPDKTISHSDYICQLVQHLDHVTHNAPQKKDKEGNTYSEVSHDMQYLRDLIKYNKAIENVGIKHTFFEQRIKQAIGCEQFAKLDDEVDLIYLKKPAKATQFTRTVEFNKLCEKIYQICNHPIRKVKANMQMKKAVNEAIAIEEARIKQYSSLNQRFHITDLIKIIQEVAKKHKIPDRDLQDKIITKEVMVRFINTEINTAFGFAKGDQVIQIGTVLWRVGDSNICHNNIITLGGCDAFKVGDQNCEIISKVNPSPENAEKEVLTEWSKFIELHDPDIIIGYNIFGFDESFMYDRITDLCLDTERMTPSKEDLKSLEQNKTYQTFINLSRLDM
jgi:DNA polymerase elongation subunit (family B)